MKTLSELKKELQTLRRQHQDIRKRIETQNNIDKLKEEIRLMELKDNKNIKAIKKISNPIINIIKTTAIGFVRMGRYLWNNGLKQMFESLGNAGARMYNMDRQGSKNNRKKSRSKSKANDNEIRINPNFFDDDNQVKINPKFFK